MPKVTLSVQGKQSVEVRAVSGYANLDLATTGTLVFGQFPLASTLVPQGWDETLGLLRADFQSPADYVRIDIIFDDDDIAALWAFDASGNQLDVFDVSGDPRLGTPNAVATITRANADIAYILAGGRIAEAVFLDNLQVRIPEGTAIPEPTTIALAALGLTALGFTRRRRK